MPRGARGVKDSGSYTDQSPEPTVAVYELALGGRWPREGVPNLRRRLRLHAHLLHEPVKEVFSFRVRFGLEPSLEVIGQAANFVQGDGRKL
jgi:hypothetical protein